MARRNRKSKMINPKLKKTVVELMKKVSYSTQETKMVNAPDATVGAANTVNLSYAAASGLQYLVTDIFSMRSGVLNSTTVGSANRIGDKIHALGIKMNYYFSTYSSYGSPSLFGIPYVKVRVLVFQLLNDLVPNPLLPLVLDTNFVGTGAFVDSTLQPFNAQKGLVKRVVYDKVHIIRNNAANQGSLGPAAAAYPLGNVFHFEKYIKIGKDIKYNDSSTTNPNGTEMPYCVAIVAEIDNTTLYTASAQRILTTSGYTVGYYKDA